MQDRQYLYVIYYDNDILKIHPSIKGDYQFCFNYYKEAKCMIEEVYREQPFMHLPPNKVHMKLYRNHFRIVTYVLDKKES